MKKHDVPVVDPGDEVMEDVQQLARELWTVNNQMKDRQDERDEATQVIKALKKRREEIVTKIAKCGRYVSPVSKVA